MTSLLDTRPTSGGLPVPFACEDDDGSLDHSSVVKRRAIRCALSRICGICGEPLTRPVAFLGPEAEWRSGLFTFPPTHHACATEALNLFAPLGGKHLGQAEPPLQWALVATGGFDLIRPTTHGGIIQFRPNSVIDSTIVG
ncbi:hypothetical protein J2X11_000126 [Aeromicrobium panaciterrae]|uniref:Uncharacterized protein n=1 Tax=Aeromicrobium panaciterrae TaxID=363861 RepID=A0ABU1UJB3_9ACTN|nr:hypothetical protein [Aeromicrobium panaciterrae]MDR7085287.1 hypothetical protein [Aeromicrobium panaciterrae]